MKNNGQIILINGASGTGKSTLCRQLIEQLYLPYVHISIDRFYEGLPQRPLTGLQHACLPTIYQGFLASVAAFASAGNRTLLDIVLANYHMKKSILSAFAATPTYLVGLECHLNTLQARNRKRSHQRQTSTLHKQMLTVHEEMHYDLYFDTTHLSPGKCADQVIHYLDSGLKPTAFATLCQESAHEL